MADILLRYSELFITVFGTVVVGLAGIICFFMQRLIERIDNAIMAVNIITGKLDTLDKVHTLIQADQTSLWNAHNRHEDKIQHIELDVAVLKDKIPK